MTSAKKFDQVDARRIDKHYAAPTLVEQRRRTMDALALRPGETVVDIGCGPGYLTLEMARVLGPGGHAIGVDASRDMLEVARARCGGYANVEFGVADATVLPLADGSIDAAVAVQVYLFVPDLERACGELARVLKPGGRAVVMDTDWDSLVWHSGDAARMHRFIEVWKKRYADATVARRFPGCLRRAGLTIERADAVAIVELTPDEPSYSGDQVTEVAKYVGGKGGLAPEEAQAWATDLRARAAAGEYFFALNRYLFVARKPGRSD